MPMLVSVFDATTPGGFVAPPGATHVQLVGWGGGGGGGAGGDGPRAGFLMPGGGGGGGAQQGVAVVAVVPGEAYDIVVGTGGAGGPTFVGDERVAPGHGRPGSDTRFVRARDGVVLATFKGAGGGQGSFVEERSVAGRQLLSKGGAPVADARSVGFAYSDDRNYLSGPLPAGTGGFGVGNEAPLVDLAARPSNIHGFREGRIGPCGRYDPMAAELTLYGGGGGGGGAAGPGGDGGAGGGGGHYGRFDSEGFGENGGAADDGSGAGGGGGGSGGSLASSVKAGIPAGTRYSVPGAGGDGGSGRLTILCVV